MVSSDSEIIVAHRSRAAQGRVHFITTGLGPKRFNLKNGEGVWGKGLFILFRLSFKIFLLWVLLRVSVMGVPLDQGKSAPAEYSLLAYKNTVLRDHCSKRRLTLKDTHLFEHCS
jgi:hypothetical protein